MQLVGDSSAKSRTWGEGTKHAGGEKENFGHASGGMAEGESMLHDVHAWVGTVLVSARGRSKWALQAWVLGFDKNKNTINK